MYFFMAKLQVRNLTMDFLLYYHHRVWRDDDNKCLSAAYTFAGGNSLYFRAKSTFGLEADICIILTKFEIAQHKMQADIKNPYISSIHQHQHLNNFIR